MKVKANISHAHMLRNYHKTTGVLCAFYKNSQQVHANDQSSAQDWLKWHRLRNHLIYFHFEDGDLRQFCLALDIGNLRFGLILFIFIYIRLRTGGVGLRPDEVISSTFRHRRSKMMP